MARRSAELSWWRKLAEALRRILAMDSKRYLCDSCTYDYPSACSRPSRPNALKCPDYKKK